MSEHMVNPVSKNIEERIKRVQNHRGLLHFLSGWFEQAAETGTKDHKLAAQEFEIALEIADNPQNDYFKPL